MYQIRLLELSGVRPHLTACVSCLKEIQTQAFFSVKSGGFLCNLCYNKDRFAKPLSGQIISSLRYIQDNSFKTSLRLSLPEKTEKEILEILEEFFGFHLDTRMKSLAAISSLDS